MARDRGQHAVFVKMPWQMINLADVVPVPWKNGGGTTRELAAWPDSKRWLWRMSVAEVARSGPFSRFDGVERWFAVLDGNGVALRQDGQLANLTADSAPYCFDGSAPSDCDLLDGPTHDFNLMTRLAADGSNKFESSPAGARATVTRVRGVISAEIRVAINTITFIAIYSISTWTNVRFDGVDEQIDPGSLVWRTVTMSDVVRIEARDALLIEITVSASPGSSGMPSVRASGLERAV